MTFLPNPSKIWGRSDSSFEYEVCVKLRTFADIYNSNNNGDMDGNVYMVE